jgi:glutamate synthase (ferredoxin)
MVFLPKKENQRTYCIGVFESEIEKQGLNILGWRKVPVNPEVVGSIAAQTEPYIMQVFIGRGATDSPIMILTSSFLAHVKLLNIQYQTLNFLRLLIFTSQVFLLIL